MEKISLNENGITKEQYSKYQDYKSKLELRKEKINNFEDKFMGTSKNPIFHFQFVYS